MPSSIAAASGLTAERALGAAEGCAASRIEARSLLLYVLVDEVPDRFSSLCSADCDPAFLAIAASDCAEIVIAPHAIARTVNKAARISKIPLPFLYRIGVRRAVGVGSDRLFWIRGSAALIQSAMNDA
jgi:hypothetical protein